MSYSYVHDLEEWLWEACEWWKIWGVQYSSPQVNKARADKWYKSVPPTLSNYHLESKNPKVKSVFLGHYECAI